MTRNGKVARLPREIREELNIRLQDGECGGQLVDWLNGLPQVQAVMKAAFAGRPINDQNLSEWKLGGYEDWVRHQNARQAVLLLKERGEDWDALNKHRHLSEDLSLMLTAELATMSQQLLAETTETKERWKVLQQLLGQVGALCQQHTKDLQVGMAISRFANEASEAYREHCERKIKESRDKSTGKILASEKMWEYARAHSGWNKPVKVAATLLENEYGLENDTLWHEGDDEEFIEYEKERREREWAAARAARSRYDGGFDSSWGDEAAEELKIKNEKVKVAEETVKGTEVGGDLGGAERLDGPLIPAFSPRGGEGDGGSGSEDMGGIETPLPNRASWGEGDGSAGPIDAAGCTRTVNTSNAVNPGGGEWIKPNQTGRLEDGRESEEAGVNPDEVSPGAVAGPPENEWQTTAEIADSSRALLFRVATDQIVPPSKKGNPPIEPEEDREAAE